MKISMIATIINQPNVRTSNDQTQARLPVLVSEHWTTAAGQDGSRETQFSIDARGRRAEEIAASGAVAGEKIFIEGDVDVRPFTDRQGEFRAPMMVRPFVLRFLGNAKDEDYLKLNDIGNLGRDPEMRYLENGEAATYFSVAINRYSGSGDSREQHTQWIDIATYGDLAESCNNYIGRGSSVSIEANRVKVNTWSGQDGNHHATLNVAARRVQFLTRAGQGESTPAGSSAPATASDAPVGGMEDGDDIPWD